MKNVSRDTIQKIRVEQISPNPGIAEYQKEHNIGDHKTAMAETRPWIGSTISVGTFKLNREVTLVDFSEESSKKYYFNGNTRSAKEKEEAVWANIGWAFSIPIATNDNTAEYAPTQILAELFKITY